MKKKNLLAVSAFAAVMVFGASLSTLTVYADETESTETESTGSWQEEDGAMYWYEDGVKQGTDGRGKEIYDPDSDAWYWLDAVQSGAKAVSKDVYQESYAGRYADNDDETGKWVRYDENGKMVKGWQDTDAGTYYFDPETGAMAKGYTTVDGKEYYFNTATGILESGGYEVPETGWLTIDGSDYWYEDYYRQGYSLRESYRGKEIYDPDSAAWYWLDNVQGGAKAVSKDVYQESEAGDWAEEDDGTGKWVRYDENGHMVKGWQETDKGTYYFDKTYGTMAKGVVYIQWLDDNDVFYYGVYYFDEASGILSEYVDPEADYSGITSAYGVDGLQPASADELDIYGEGDHYAYKDGITLYYFKDSEVDTTYTGMAKTVWAIENEVEYRGWYYVVNGVVDWTYDGIVDSPSGTTKVWIRWGKFDVSWSKGYLLENDEGWWIFDGNVATHSGSLDDRSYRTEAIWISGNYYYPVEYDSNGFVARLTDEEQDALYEWAGIY